MRADVAVLCVTHNSREDVVDFHAAVLGSTSRSLRIVYVDSGSTDDTLDVLGSLVADGDICDLGANRGFAAGINEGMRRLAAEGGARAVVVANADVRPDPGCLDLLVDAVAEPGVAIACPQLRDEFGHRLPSLHRLPTAASAWAEAVVGGHLAERWRLPSEEIRRDSVYATGCDVGWATGGLIALSAERAGVVGEWDESLWMYEEEVDFARRAFEAGFRTRYVPGARAVRRVGTNGVDPWRRALMTRNRARLAWRRGPGTGALTVGALLVGEGIRALAGRPEARAGFWSVTRRASVLQVMSRYVPEAKPVVGAAPTVFARHRRPTGSPT